MIAKLLDERFFLILHEGHVDIMILYVSVYCELSRSLNMNMFPVKKHEKSEKCNRFRGSLIV